MKRTADTSVADSFSSYSDDEKTGLTLSNGSRIAVAGGGPSGSFLDFSCKKWLRLLIWISRWISTTPGPSFTAARPVAIIASEVKRRH